MERPEKAELGSGKKTAATEILEFAIRLEKHALGISDRMDEKLTGVMSQPTPQTEPSGKDSSEYPPFFQELRSIFNSIQQRLESMANMLDRTEL
jgi:hypothetical protein